MLDALKNFVSGKKTILTAIVGMIGAIIAWGDSSIDAPTALGMIWAGLLVIFQRLGTQKAEEAAKTTTASAVASKE